LRTPISVYRKVPRRMPLEVKWSNYCLFFDNPYGDVKKQHIRVPHSDSLNVTSVTLEAWFKALDMPSDLPYVWNVIIIKDNQYALFFNNDLQRFFGGVRIGGTWYWSDGGGYPFTPDGRWHHICFTYTSGDMALYLDGVRVRYRTDVTGDIDTTTNPLFIGGVYEAGEYDLHYWNGWLDELRVLPVALTQQRVLESFHRGYARRELDARLVMRLEEGVGLTAYDKSGYGNNGSLGLAGDPPKWTPVALYELLAEADL